MPDYLPRGSDLYTEHKGRYVSRQLLKPGSNLGRDIDYPDRLFLLILWDEVRLSPVGASATNWPIGPAPGDI
jgi:hypothetical protein